MSGSNNSGSNTSKMAVPQAKEAMNRFKQEVASEIGVPLKEGYNGDLFCTGRKHRRRDGQKNDHETGRADVREVKNNFPQVKNNLPQDQKRLHIHGVM